ncbi:MAG: efflux RND transporter periplasmic adaptor subunit [Acidaminococcaceae bacterium]|jgi:HlyD family secretion protein|nr:efflux RND transporter periplasmic adaptor subunit [Acidaminococcaceae bacterium]
MAFQKPTLTGLQQKVAGLKDKFLALDKRQRLICVGVVLVLLLFLVRGCQFLSQNKTAKQGKQDIAVHVQEVQKRDLAKSISLVGQTVPKAQVDVAAKYQGRVLNVYAELGQKVAAGDLLIEEDTRDAAIQVEQNQHAYQEAVANIQTNSAQLNANLSKYKADYDKAQRTYERYLHVFNAGGISKETLAGARQAMEDAKGNYDAVANQFTDGEASSILAARETAAKAKATVEASKKQHSDLLLTASMDGIIGYRNVEAGNMVSAGQKLLSIFDTSTMYVDYQVAEADLPVFKVGMPLTVSITSLGKDFQGNIIYISPQIDTSTMNYMLRVSLDNGDGLLKGGMFADAKLKDMVRRQVITVPKAAVVSKNGKTLTYVLQAEKNTVAQREVRTGASGDDAVEILDGLQLGEKVATTNLARLYDGAQVQALADQAE